MNPKLFQFLKYTLLLALIYVLLFFAFKGVNVNKILHDIRYANMFWVVVSAIFSITAFIIRAYRWNLLIEPLGYSPALKITTYSVMIGYFANLAFPRLGEVTRCGSLSKSESVPFNKLLGTVIVERAIDVLSLLICMLLAAFLEFKRLGNFFIDNITNPLTNKLSRFVNTFWLMLVVLLVLGVLIFFLFYFFRKSKDNRRGSAAKNLIYGFLNGLRSVAHIKRPWLFIFHSFLIWFLYYLGVLTALNALAPTQGLGYSAALFLLVAGGLGMSAPVQGGIGAYHLLVSQGLMLYGLSQQDGLTFATLVHSIQLILVIVFGAISMLLLTMHKRNKGVVQAND